MATVRLDDEVNDALKRYVADHPGTSATKVTNTVLRRALRMDGAPPAKATKKKAAAPARRRRELTPKADCKHPGGGMIGDYCPGCDSTVKGAKA